MLKKARFILPAVAVAAVIAVPSGSSAEDGIPGECPDGYTPMPVFLAPDEDRNGNGVVCTKFVGSHQNTHDDPNGQRYRCNGFPTPPPQCITDPDGSFFILDDTV